MLLTIHKKIRRLLDASPERSPLLIREERLPSQFGLKLLFISDLHLMPSNHAVIISQVRTACKHVEPDLVLLGGDIVDNISGIPYLPSLFEAFSPLPVFAVSGNHEERSCPLTFRRALEAAGCGCLDDHAHRFDWRGKGIWLLGNAKQAEDHIGHASVLCFHDPKVFPAAQRANIPLTLSGHIHGGQFVFFKLGERLYPGALAYRWNGTRFTRGNSTLIVSRGVTDTLPLRLNCPREVVVCHL